MTVRSLVLQLLWLSLCGCSSGQELGVAPPHRSFVYWHGRDGDHLNLPRVGKSHHQGPKLKPAEEAKSEIEDRSAIERKEAELDKLPKYSHEWVVLRKQIDAEEDARIAKILVICRGCETDGSELNKVASSDH